MRIDGSEEKGMGPVLVAGARGFLGRHLVEQLLERGVEVGAIVPPEGPESSVGLPAAVRVAAADAREAASTAEAIRRLRPAAVVNLVRSRGGPAEPRGDAEIAANLVAAAGAGCRRLVHLGSGLEYGAPAGTIDEATPLRPQTPFGDAKARATEVVMAAGSGDLATAVLRPFMVYGPGEPERRLIPTAARAALRGETLPLTAAGCRRDWVYVADVARAIVLALRGAADGEVVNLASGRESANEEVAKLAAAAVGRPLLSEPGALQPRPWDVASQRVSTGKARAVLGWRAEVALEAGVPRTVAGVTRAGAERSAALR